MTNVLASLAARAAGLPFAAERAALQPRPLARFEGPADIAADALPAIPEPVPFAHSPSAHSTAAELREAPQHRDPTPARAGQVPSRPATRTAPASKTSVSPANTPPTPPAPVHVADMRDAPVPREPGSAPSTASHPMQAPPDGRHESEGPSETTAADWIMPARRLSELPSSPTPTTVAEPRPTDATEPGVSPPPSVIVTIGRIVVEQVQPPPVAARPPDPARTAGFDAYAAQRRGRLR